MLKKMLASATCAACVLSISHAYADNGSLPDDHAPIGVMADHDHNKGEWMTSYRYSYMEMDGNRDGTSGTSVSSVLNDFSVSPLDMSMEMHMFGLMYGASNKLTLMGMVPYVKKSMNHFTGMGVRFNAEAEGVGDTKLSGLYTLYDSGIDPNSHRTRYKLLLNVGVSVPTGSIDERATTPAGPNQKLPYPMQLGSGTFDPIIGITYLNKHDKWSWGAQANSIWRFYDNDEGYHLGNEYGVTSWIARTINEYASVSFRLDGKAWGDVRGNDNELNPAMVPTARTDLRGGHRVDAVIGLNLYQPYGPLANHRLAAEFGMPIYQHLDGPQLETDYRFILGWQWAF